MIEIIASAYYYRYGEYLKWIYIDYDDDDAHERTLAKKKQKIYIKKKEEEGKVVLLTQQLYNCDQTVSESKQFVFANGAAQSDGSERNFR